MFSHRFENKKKGWVGNISPKKHTVTVAVVLLQDILAGSFQWLQLH
jgi:hypothetical protein